jgi:hypothetical protein
LAWLAPWPLGRSDGRIFAEWRRLAVLAALEPLVLRAQLSNRCLQFGHTPLERFHQGQ